MNNIYLKAFFKLLDTHNWKNLFTEESALDLFDMMTLAFRFLPVGDLKPFVNNLIAQGTVNGRLETILLTGLDSKLLFPLLQSYVDRTSDLQTAAYISTYAINV